MIQITDNRIDLQKSFEKLKEAMQKAENAADHPYYGTSYNILEEALEEHLKECTLPENSKDDIPKGLFEKMGKLLNPDNNKLK